MGWDQAQFHGPGSGFSVRGLGQGLELGSCSVVGVRGLNQRSGSGVGLKGQRQGSKSSLFAQILYA